MRDQRCLLLSLLGLGILIFPKIDAGPYDVARLAHRIINGDASQVDEEGCFEWFHDMMQKVTDDSQIGKGPDGSNVNKISMALLSCILTGEISEVELEKDSDASGNQRVPGSRYRPGTRRMGSTRNRISESRNGTIDTSVVTDQIDHFEYRPNYVEFNKRLLSELHKEIKDFIEAGLGQEYKQENYANLVKVMLHAVIDTTLSDDLIPDVEAAIDKRLEPYVSEKVKIQLPGYSRTSSGKSKRRRIRKPRNGLRPTTLNCDTDEFEPLFECIFSYVVGLVELEHSLTVGSVAEDFWDPFGAKLIQDLEQLLIKITEQTSSRNLLDKDVPNVKMIFEARAAVISCLRIMREKYDAEGRGTVVGKAEDAAISKCVDSALKQAKHVEDYFTIEAGMGKMDADIIIAIKEDSIREIWETTMKFYPKVTDLGNFVRAQIKGGILTGDNDPEESFAWHKVREWNESSIADVNTRFATLFGDGSLLQATIAHCHLNIAESITGHSLLVSHGCFRAILEDLLIMESAIFEDGVSLEVIFYGHPILSNYIYIVHQELATKIRECIPVKEGMKTYLPERDGLILTLGSLLTFPIGFV